MESALHRHREGAWSLDEFIEVANSLLPDYLPKDASERSAESVNQRLARHYSTQGLLDEPLKEGREARYFYRHLLQLLALRRLLAEGLSSALVKRVLEGKDDADLEGLLGDRLRIDLVPQKASDDERMRFLEGIRARAGLAPQGAQRPPAQPPGAPPHALTATPGQIEPLKHRPPADSAGLLADGTWTRLRIEDGLELHVRDDYRLPTTRLGDAELMRLLKVTLLYLEQKQRGKP